MTSTYPLPYNNLPLKNTYVDPWYPYIKPYEPYTTGPWIPITTQTVTSTKPKIGVVVEEQTRYENVIGLLKLAKSLGTVTVIISGTNKNISPLILETYRSCKYVDAVVEHTPNTSKSSINISFNSPYDVILTTKALRNVCTFVANDFSSIPPILEY